jgi:hypothetical protein
LRPILLSEYSYDAAHRLREIRDARCSTVTYTLDAMGREVEDTRDPGGNLAKTLAREYDALNRLKKLTGVQ